MIKTRKMMKRTILKKRRNRKLSRSKKKELRKR